ncbi:MAG TPA: ABC transporter permease [Burkholderiales bacterium]|nr:ABC transporter permease [Burkholderiales bacterium]
MSGTPGNDHSARGRQIAAIARFTLLEAGRVRLWWLFIAILAIACGAAWFVHQLAITESARIQTAFLAAMVRLAAVFVLTLHILTSIVREFNDKGLELILSFDLRRGDYVLGRLLGFLLIALLIALLATAPQLALAPPHAALQWGLSLACELAIVAALSLFCIMTFTQLMPAASFVLGFYLLARTLTAIRLMDAAPLTGADLPSHQVISWVIDGLALVLPALDRYAQGAWLIGDSAISWPASAALAAQAALYTVLLAAATTFDFQRRNL